MRGAASKEYRPAGRCGMAEIVTNTGRRYFFQSSAPFMMA